MFNWECFKIINTSLNPESSGFDSPALVLQSKSHLGGDGLALLVEHGGSGVCAARIPNSHTTSALVSASGQAAPLVQSR